MTRIVLLAALPQEYGPLKRLLGPWHVVERRPFPKFVSLIGEKEIFLIETGMGKASVVDVLEREIKSHTPDLIVSMGFAGSLCEDFGIGDVLLGETLIGLPAGASSYPSGSELLRFKPSPSLLGFCREAGLRCAQIVTAVRPESKLPFSRNFKATPSAMDMESFHVARKAQELEIPFLCLRSISDGLYDEIDFNIESLIDSSGRVRISAVLKTILRRPAIVKSFYASWKRSNMAARQLGHVVSALLRKDSRSLIGLGLHAPSPFYSGFGKGNPQKQAVCTRGGA